MNLNCVFGRTVLPDIVLHEFLKVREAPLEFIILIANCLEIGLGQFVEPFSCSRLFNSMPVVNARSPAIASEPTWIFLLSSPLDTKEVETACPVGPCVHLGLIHAFLNGRQIAVVLDDLLQLALQFVQFGHHFALGHLAQFLDGVFEAIGLLQGLERFDSASQSQGAFEGAVPRFSLAVLRALDVGGNRPEYSALVQGSSFLPTSASGCAFCIARIRLNSSWSSSKCLTVCSRVTPYEVRLRTASNSSPTHGT